ncbi:MAG: hypothetical protein ACR2I5_03800 [Candidatus Limnocylindria bacterium]
MLLLRWAWPLAMFAALAVTILGDGFNPTDEGLVAAAAQRILDGQVPHIDFISPRPAVSALLHAPETLLPTPIFLTGRAIALAQIIGFSVLLGWLILDRSPATWGIAAVLGVAASALVNLNTIPLMAWYTTDGLFLAAIGLVTLGAGLRGVRPGVIGLAFVALALAAMAKQSFAPVLIVGLAWVVVASPRDRRLRRVVVAVGSAAVPMVAYVAWVAANGGWVELVRQLTSTQPVLDGELLAPMASPVSAVLLVAAPTAVVWFRHRRTATESAWLIAPANVAALVLTVLVLTILVTSGLRVTAFWGILLSWLLAAYVVARAILLRDVDGTALVVVLLAWMTSLSYGVPVPSLVAGSVTLVLLHRTWLNGPSLVTGLRMPAPLSIAFGVLLLVAVPAFAVARADYIHRDAPRAELTADLGSLSRELSGIRTNERTAAYLGAMRECVETHPADRVAVLPDNPAVYPAFGWVNPFPLDFFFPPEYAGSRDRLVASAHDVAADGDYLVLFQRVRADSLLNRGIDLSGGDGEHTYDPALTDELRQILGAAGEPVSCGAFDGFQAPARP